MRNQSPKPAQPWPAYAADSGATHYSPLEDITPANVRALTVASEWGTGEQPLEAFGAQLGNFQNTPLMIDNVPHVSTRSRATRSGRTIDDEPYCVAVPRT